MVNGAGLAMATMDAIKLAGGEPANFLDIGTANDTGRVVSSFRILTEDPNVRAILINIFGGMARVDMIAQGIIEADREIEHRRPARRAPRRARTSQRAPHARRVRPRTSSAAET